MSVVNRALALLFAVMTAMQISPEKIENRMKYLASDLMEGRETGTRGYDAAAVYVATQFREAGAFAEYQTVPLKTATLDAKASTLSIDGTPLTYGTDFLLRGDPMNATLDASAPVVFAGFGVVAPELKHDDYSKLDASGKIVAMLSGAPSSFPHDQRAYYSSAEVKRKAAADHGAIAIITIPTITDAKRGPWEKRVPQSLMPSMIALDPDGKPLDAQPALRGNATLNREAAAKLFAHAPMTLERVLEDAEKHVAHSFALGATASIHTVSTVGTTESQNVIGLVLGTDIKLRNQTVVVTAHLDHLGNHPPANGGDGIYNGALDNASGVACLIEMCRAQVKAPQKRSIAFVAVTGEEKGLLGSEFYTRYPTMPREGILANINMDMFTMLFPVADVVLLGAEHSSLGPLAARAAKESGFSVSPDPLPEEVRFIRSDQYSFVRAGIPAITMKGGEKSRDAKIDGAGVLKAWLHDVYHTPKDDMSQHFDYASAARFAEANLKLARMIAESNERPQWKKGDFFGERFAASKRKATITVKTP
jgi:Zn-dependent M28 family amino/carboxypeptidase